MGDLELDPATTGLLLIDVQQKLVAAMPDEPTQRAMKAWAALVEMAGRLQLPIAVTEQYPKGLGPTLPMLREMLGKISPPPRFVEKLDFSACGVALFEQFLAGAQGRTWLVAGIETHVCVYQTVRGLTGRGHRVHVMADACLSRHESNHRAGLALMERAGAVHSSTEIALFDLVRRAEGETFKALSRLVR